MIDDVRHGFDSEVTKNIALHVDELNKFNNCWKVDFYDRYISIQKLDKTIVTIDIAGPIRFSGSLGVSAIEARQIFKMLEEFTTDVDTIREFKGIY